MNRTRAQLRAAAITLVLLVHGIAVLPVPHVVRPHELDDPVARAEVTRWAERLTGVGYPISPDELGAEVVRWSTRLGRAHRTALLPMRPWFRWTGTGQGWALFANPDTHPSRMEVAVVRGGQEQLVYRRLDPDLGWLRDPLAYRRVRGVYDATSARHRPTAASRRLADWLEDEARRSDPTVEGVLVRFVATPHPLPSARRRGRGSSKVRYTLRSKGLR